MVWARKKDKTFFRRALSFVLLINLFSWCRRKIESRDVPFIGSYILRKMLKLFVRTAAEETFFFFLASARGAL